MGFKAWDENITKWIECNCQFFFFWKFTFSGNLNWLALKEQDSSEHSEPSPCICKYLVLPCLSNLILLLIIFATEFYPGTLRIKNMRCEFVIIWRDRRLQPFADIKQVNKKVAEVNEFSTAISSIVKHIFIKVDVK